MLNLNDQCFTFPKFTSDSSHQMHQQYFQNNERYTIFIPKKKETHIDIVNMDSTNVLTTYK